MIDAILSRRSVRSFLTDPVSAEELDILLKAGFHAPSAVNQRPCHFVILEGARLLEILDGCRNIPKGSPLAIMVCIDSTREKMPGLGDPDAAAVTENILLAAEELGLGAVWCAVFPDSAVHCRAALGLPASVRPYSIVPVGRPAKRPERVDRFDSTRIHRNGW